MANTKRYGNNPYVTDAMHGKTAKAFDEEGVYFTEYQSADREPARIHEECGGTAFRKPSVGAFICCKCGAIDFKNQWPDK